MHSTHLTTGNSIHAGEEGLAFAILEYFHNRAKTPSTTLIRGVPARRAIPVDFATEMFAELSRDKSAHSSASLCFNRRSDVFRIFDEFLVLRFASIRPRIGGVEILGTNLAMLSHGRGAE